MTTLDDFDQTLTNDPSDWLVLADWLEENGDERAKWVRFISHDDRFSLVYANGEVRWRRFSVEDSTSSSLDQLLDSMTVRDVLQGMHECCFDAVMALAEALRDSSEPYFDDEFQKRLTIFKYGHWAAGLTKEQLMVLIWAVGELGGRYGDLSNPRAAAGLTALCKFTHRAAPTGREFGQMIEDARAEMQGRRGDENGG